MLSCSPRLREAESRKKQIGPMALQASTRTNAVLLAVMLTDASKATHLLKVSWFEAPF
jgi:hypothetical protein